MGCLASTWRHGDQGTELGAIIRNRGPDRDLVGTAGTIWRMWEDHPLSCSHPQVSPELLQPLVTVVATLGKLGTIPGDISLGGDVGSLQARLLTFSSGVRRAMMHPDGNATLLRCALRATKEQPGAPTVITNLWQKAVTAVKDIWAKLQEDAARLKDAWAAMATTETSKGHLVEAVTREDKALKGLMAATRVVALPSEVSEVVAAHDAQVAEAGEALQAASKATEEVAAAVVAAVAAKERGQHAAVAHGLLEQLVAACMGACNYYSHVDHCLRDIKALLHVTTGDHGPGVPKATTGDMAVPKELVVVAEVLWDASARLAQEHLLATLWGVWSLLATSSITEATKVTQSCQEATNILPRLLPPGPC
ncbi:hypothetical protein ASZ78_016897 [Callipepla squamata]|uniref:Uncharacterized protein n=1 Tax=Callipepla squamata TaxID=9009 RepID=A0A226M8U9_CALSU|nr:hypothetical protein ASZ78_008187 [Callipepla squamata]OXB51745.1 hypothetical protein ASZ78_003596 [Callipepla squamata]OXB51948.1 hypothetical protein ASZ78_016897 [Callipepla squamata]